MERNIFDTLDAAIENIVDDDYARPQDVVLLPPSNDPYASEEEEGDDDIGLAGNLNLPSDVTGTIEIHRNEGEDDVPANEAKGNNGDMALSCLMLTSIKMMKLVMS